MIPTHDTTVIKNFLIRIAPLTGTDLRDAFANEVIQTGGIFPAPEAFNCGFHVFELSLHDRYVCGTNVDSVIAQWTNEAHNAITHPPAIRATDGRPDCPYNGQGVA